MEMMKYKMIFLSKKTKTKKKDVKKKKKKKKKLLRSDSRKSN
jgi:hypothetical protein